MGSSKMSNKTKIKSVAKKNKISDEAKKNKLNVLAKKKLNGVAKKNKLNGVAKKNKPNCVAKKNKPNVVAKKSKINGVAKKKLKGEQEKKKFVIDKRGRVLVKNLPFKVTEAEVMEYFSKYGEISEVQLPRRKDGQIAGFGFIQFPVRRNAARAVAKTNGKDFMGRTLDVSFALQKMAYIVARSSDASVPGITGRQVSANESASFAKNWKPGESGKPKVQVDESDVKQELPNVTIPGKSEEKQRKEKPLQKRGRLIVRNLPFKTTEKALRKHFEKFGEVHDVTLLRKPDGKLVGCGFVQFTWKQNAAKAIFRTSGKPFMDRIIIVDWAVPKNVYEAKMQKEEETEIKNEPDDDVIAIKEEDEDDDDMENIKHSRDETQSKIYSDTSSESSSDYNEELEVKEENGSVESDEEHPKFKPQTQRRTVSNDVVEGCTAFVKNIPFSATNEHFKACMEQFGEVVYALVCMDQLTEHSKGTGFVKFKNKESMEKCLAAGEELLLRDQKLEVMLALPKQEIIDRAQSRKEAKRNRDNRNLYLVKEGVVVAGSKAAVGVSAADMARRLQLEQWKSQVLRNLNMFVSRTRLIVHNIPPSWDDSKLRKLFAQHAPPGALIKEARVMRNLRDLDLNGIGRSKEYGFVMFETHEAALHALRSINNNPKIFTPAKRPIVSFSIENRAILNLKQRRLMKSRDKNPLAHGKERTGKMSRVDKKANGVAKVQDAKVFQGAENEQFAGVAATAGKTKMRSRFKLKTQATVHSETVRQEKRKRKEQQRAAQMRQSNRKSAADSQAIKVFMKQKSLKGKKKEEEAFGKMVDKYRSKLLNASAIKKWYE